MRRFIFGLVFITIGVLWGLQNYGAINIDWNWHVEWHRILVPAIFVLIGLRIILGMSRNNHSKKLSDATYAESSNGEIPKLSAAFAGNRYVLNGQKFIGAKMDAFLGGIQIDLHGAEIADNSVIEISTFMGGVEIIAPDDVDFIISSNSFLGGVDNKKRFSSGRATKIITLKANCFLGGVAIK